MPLSASANHFHFMVQPAGWVAKIAELLPPNTASRAARQHGSLAALGLSYQRLAEQYLTGSSVGTATSHLSSCLGFNLDGRGNWGAGGFAGAFLAGLGGVFPPPV
jgi:hypothetical protein